MKTRMLVYALFSLPILCTAVFPDGYLTVRTEPDGIEVWLDDNFVGDSPIIDKKLKSGRYSLKLVDPVQHSSTIEEVFIQDNENTVIEKTIKSKFGSLRVTSVPEGAIVSIATELGPTPVTNDFMNPGKYRVEIHHPDKKILPVIEEITIPRGESVTLSKTLMQEKSFTTKDKWRLILGALTAASFGFAIYQSAQWNDNNLKDDYKGEVPELQLSSDNYHSKAVTAQVFTITGISVGSLSLIGLEIISIF